MVEDRNKIDELVNNALDIYNRMQDEQNLNKSIEILLSQPEDIMATVVWLFKIDNMN